MDEVRKGSMAVVDPRTGDVLFRFIARKLRLEGGKIVAIKSGAAMMNLDEDAGEIAVWEAGGKKIATITAEGYRSANVLSQITVRTPPSVEIPGKGTMPNPYIVTDEDTGAFLAGYWRKVAIAPGLTGNPVLTDRCTYLDLHSYLIEDLLNLRKRAPYAVIGGLAEVPPHARIAKFIERHNADVIRRAEEWEKERRDGKKSYLRKNVVGEAEQEAAIESAQDGLWKFMELEKSTGYGIWIDTQAEVVATVFRTYAQTRKFGSRRLEAIAYRNVMRDHPLAPPMRIPEQHLSGGGSEYVDGKRVKYPHTATVRCFFHEYLQTPEDIDALMDQFNSGVRLVGLTADVDVKPERADADEVVAEAGGEKEKPPEVEENGPQEIEVDDTTTSRQSDPKARLLAKIAEAEKFLGEKGYAALRAAHPCMETPLTATVEELTAFLKALSAKIDEVPK